MDAASGTASAGEASGRASADAASLPFSPKSVRTAST